MNFWPPILTFLFIQTSSLMLVYLFSRFPASWLSEQSSATKLCIGLAPLWILGLVILWAVARVSFKSPQKR